MSRYKITLEISLDAAEEDEAIDLVNELIREGILQIQDDLGEGNIVEYDITESELSEII